MRFPKMGAAVAAAGFLVLTSGGVFADQTTVPASGGDIAIMPVRHAAFAMTWNGVTIYADPAPPGGPAQPVIDAFKAGPPAEIILITHAHPDHLNPEVLTAIAGGATILAPQVVIDALPGPLKDKAKLMKNGDTVEIAGVKVEAVPAYNITPERLKFHPKGVGNGYVVTLGDKRVYVAGDTEDTSEMRALQNVDVAFLPMNLPYTMTVEQAADAVKAFKPKVTIPYHYGDSDVAKFKELVGDASDVRLLKWY